MYEPKLIIFREFLIGTETWMGENPIKTDEGVQEGAVEPNDSVSQASDEVSKITRKLSSRVSSKSKMSASAAFLNAEAERAALKAKSKALEQKHILDLEEAHLKAKKEKLAS